MKKGYLVLQDGQVFEGLRFGAEVDTVGELVFSTGVVGFGEALTDPSYAGQLLMQTYPLVGNVGVIREDLQSGRCQARGLVVREVCDAPSNFCTDITLDTYLKEEGVPGLCGVDTRQLTRILRDQGVMNAMICDAVPGDLTVLKAAPTAGQVAAVTCGEAVELPAEGEEVAHVCLLDCGVTRSVVRALRERGCRVTVLPAGTSAEAVLALDPDGVLLSNGPGDPAENTDLIQQVKALLGRVPVFGIGLGHQLAALALGASTYKLPYGHRGSNQPVRDRKGVRTYITSQNHGYAVDSGTVRQGEVRFVNLNDSTCEGIDYPDLRAFTVQFDPDTAGDKDSAFLYDRFVDMMKGGAL